jgi:pilus assembly protein CpaC
MILRRIALFAAIAATLAPSFTAAQNTATHAVDMSAAAYGAGAYGRPAAYPQGASGETVRVDLSSNAMETRTLSLPRGKSAVIDLPRDARDVMVSDPKVADVVLSNPRRIYVLGVGGGQTDAAFFDGSGRQLLRLNIRVDQDVSALADTLNRILPGSSIRADAVNQNIVLSGEVESPSTADKAIRLAQGFVAKPEQIINMLSVTDSEQVMLKVRIVEVNRSIIKQLGFNLNALIGQLGSTQFLLGTAATYGINGSLLGGLTGGYSVDTTQAAELQVPCASGVSGTCSQIIRPGGTNTYVDSSGVTHTISNPGTATTQTTVGSNGLNKATANIQAFESVGLVRTLAEPNLTAVSGESAKFLVGGEFPVPTDQDATGHVTVSFKQYGVGLGFTPVVLSHGRISLKLSTEVSEITNTGSFTLTGSSTTTSGTTTTSPSLVVPGLNVRRAETAVELPSGQSLMIAGLLQSVNKQELDSLPGLMQVPILGTLFRSRDYQQGETELVVIVTPYLVKPTLPGQLQTPADGLVMANDIETNLLGKLNKSTGRTPPKDKTYQGPIGYVVE